jgi:NAD(P)-dependent dehydrogenase (short-subunit alcohol dehydrogenase family)
MNSSMIAEPPTATNGRPHQVQPPEPLTGAANSLKDKVAIITGAVGNLGTATARLFQQAGAKTVLVDRTPDRVRELFKDILDSSDHLLAGGIDLSDAASLCKLIEQTLAKFGRVDALVNTVGGYRGGKPVHEADLADFEDAIKAGALHPPDLEKARAAVFINFFWRNIEYIRVQFIHALLTGIKDVVLAQVLRRQHKGQAVTEIVIVFFGDTDARKRVLRRVCDFLKALAFIVIKNVSRLAELAVYRVVGRGIELAVQERGSISGSRQQARRRTGNEGIDDRPDHLVP